VAVEKHEQADDEGADRRGQPHSKSKQKVARDPGS
jgi:hypothetical protein